MQMSATKQLYLLLFALFGRSGIDWQIQLILGQSCWLTSNKSSQQSSQATSQLILIHFSNQLELKRLRLFKWAWRKFLELETSSTAGASILFSWWISLAWAAGYAALTQAQLRLVLDIILWSCFLSGDFMDFAGNGNDPQPVGASLTKRTRPPRQIQWLRDSLS